MKYPPRNWCVLAIDPGKAPTICAYWDRGESVKWYDSEHTSGWRKDQPGPKNGDPAIDPNKVKHIIEYHNPHLIVVEKVWVRPGQGVASQAKLVYCYAYCEGLAKGLGKSLLSIFPQTWMKSHGLITRDKGFHRQFAALHGPQWAWAFTRKKDHDRADAYLMAVTGLKFMDRMYDLAVRKGAPLDYVPQFDLIR